MLLIHKPHSYKKLFFLVITSIGSIGALLGLSALTYTPELSHAETVVGGEPGREKRTLLDITYMHEMTPEICKNTDQGKEKKLIDFRDSKKYWVSKLADNNCWMTQNLDFNIPSSSLSATYTDITVDWNSSTNNKYPPTATQTGEKPSGFNDGSNPTQAYSLVASWDPAQGGDPTYCPGMKCNEVSNSSNNDGHDAQGNYYTFNAATAGSGSLNSGNAADSICPKNWRLPVNQTEGITYNNLLQHYTFGASMNDIDISAAPLYFVYGGHLTNDWKLNFGNEGRYWSATAYNSAIAYILHFQSGSINPSNNTYARYDGSFVRCVARGGEKTLYDNIQINVGSTISLDITNEVVVEKTDTNPSTADLNVKVSSNQPYSVKINAKGHADLTSSTTDVSIPSNGGALNTATNNWGIMKPNDTTYTKVTTTPELFYQAISPEAKDIIFKIGISTSPDIPNGEYSTDLTITATQN